MPMHRGFLPREGFGADVVLDLIRGTVLNPALLLPLVLFARFTEQGQEFSILHPTAMGRLKALLCFALVRKVNNWFSDKVRNNWVSDKYDWSKEIVLVTGGAAGIGACIVKLFDEMGTTVVVLDIQPLTFAASSNVHFFHCDIRSPADLATVAEDIRKQVGPPTVLVNNAGVARGKTILDAEPADVRYTFDVNTFAHFWVTKAFLPHLVAKNHGMVVTVASYASWITVSDLTDYSASKAAALVFHEGLSAELTSRYGAHKVRTIAVHPGGTNTALFSALTQGKPMSYVEPESVAEGVVKQMLSGRSGHVIMPETTGTILAALRVLPDWLSYSTRSGYF